MPVFFRDTASQTQAIEGFLTRYENVVTAGQAFYARPGHIPLLFAGTEVIVFSPTTQLARTMGVVMENLAAARR